MSINVDSPNDDISTSASAPPTLGGQNPLVANNATVTANSDGNVSRWVMDTAIVNVATYWAKIATFTNTTGATNALTLALDINHPGGSAGSEKTLSTRLSVDIRDAVGGVGTSTNIQVMSSSSGPYSYNDFLLVGTTTIGQGIELWARMSSANFIARKTVVYEESISQIGAWTISYNNGAAWQASTPTGAVTIASNWAGSGPLTSTSLSNSTGTVYYEKSSDGIVTVDFVLTALTTTTDATTYFTMPAGFRHGISGLALDSILSGVIAGGAAGALRMSDVGVVAIYNYAASTGNWRASFRYRARA